MSYSLIKLEWEPTSEGVEVNIGGVGFNFNPISVREFRDDMEEADFLNRGFEKVEELAADVQERDKVRVVGHNLTVASVLTERGNRTVLQFLDMDGEIVVPSDEQITVYRVIE